MYVVHVTCVTAKNHHKSHTAIIRSYHGQQCQWIQTRMWISIDDTTKRCNQNCHQICRSQQKERACRALAQSLKTTTRKYHPVQETRSDITRSRINTLLVSVMYTHRTKSLLGLVIHKRWDWDFAAQHQPREPSLR